MSGKFNVRGIWWRHFLPMVGLTVFLGFPATRRHFVDAGWRWAYILVFSFSLCFCLTPLFRRLALKFNVLDWPAERKVHAAATPLLGGGAVFSAFVISLMVNGIFDAALGVILAAAAVLFLVGLLDDMFELPAIFKLVVQLAGAGVVISVGVVLRVLPDAAGIAGDIGNIGLTLVWVVGVTNAMNFFDGMDGMATGMGGIIAFFLGVVAFQSHQPLLGWVAVAMVGSCIGFLPYNLLKSGPATIFLGDAGSTVIGFTLACIAVYGNWAEGNPVAALAPPVLIFWVLIFDMVHITVDRILLGKVRSLQQWIEYVGRDHLHHRIALVLGGPKRSVLFIYLLTFCLGIGAVVLLRARTIDVFLLIVQAAMIVAMITILERRGRALKDADKKDGTDILDGIPETLAGQSGTMAPPQNL